jgi:hypothetical protein
MLFGITYGKDDDAAFVDLSSLCTGGVALGGLELAGMYALLRQFVACRKQMQ